MTPPAWGPRGGAILPGNPTGARGTGVWDPDREYWGEEGDPIEEWARPIIARGPRPAFEMDAAQTSLRTGSP